MLPYFTTVVMKFIQAMKSIFELVVDETYGVMHHMALPKKKFDFCQAFNQGKRLEYMIYWSTIPL